MGSGAVENFDYTVDCLVYTYSAISGHFTGSCLIPVQSSSVKKYVHSFSRN